MTLFALVAILMCLVALAGWANFMTLKLPHGALSLALALSLPRGDEPAVLLAVTYAVVAFSVAVQGLTFGPMVRKLSKSGKHA